MTDTPLLRTVKEALPDHLSIESPLNQGGQGAVFDGRCNGDRAAIKVFYPNAETERVTREIELLRELDCQHVVGLVDTCTVTASGQDFMVVAYEYHDGGDLMQYVKESAESLDETALLRIGLEVSHGIETLWANRIVHRDIKPGNIVRAADGRCVLVDLGLARHLDLTDITHPGFGPGTPGFRSPEHLAGRRNLTIAADIYSLGMTLLCLAKRGHPLDGKDFQDGDYERLKRSVDELSVSERFRDLLLRLLSPKAFLRPANPSVVFSTAMEEDDVPTE